MLDIAQNLDLVRSRIAQAAHNCDRNPAEITLIAVSKTRPGSDLARAIANGQHYFGESYVQEAIEKIVEIGREGVEWHFVGPIQSNKTRQIANNFDWVHSIDRLKIAQRLSEQRSPELPPLNICIQVNISKEASKAGVDVNEVFVLVESVTLLPNLILRGLMAIPQKVKDFDAQRAAFRQLAKLQENINQKTGLHLDVLSMGMSRDLEAAICEGATHVRVGTDIFGVRENRVT